MKTEYFDTEEGLCEIPLRHINLNPEETKLFGDFVHKANTLLAQLKCLPDQWRFVEIALGFFTKAFFTEGIEQLLWHITVVEALLGEKKDGIVVRLARRLSSLATENERKAVKKLFMKGSVLENGYKLYFLVAMKPSVHKDEVAIPVPAGSLT